MSELLTQKEADQPKILKIAFTLELKGDDVELFREYKRREVIETDSAAARRLAVLKLRESVALPLTNEVAV